MLLVGFWLTFLFEYFLKAFFPFLHLKDVDVTSKIVTLFWGAKGMNVFTIVRPGAPGRENLLPDNLSHWHVDLFVAGLFWSASGLFLHEVFIIFPAPEVVHLVSVSFILRLIEKGNNILISHTAISDSTFLVNSREW